MTSIRISLCNIAILAVFTLLGGCGGGSGGTASIAYTGSTTPAVLTQSNGGDMVSGAYLGGNSSVVIGGVTAGLTNNDSTIEYPRSLVLSRALTQVVLQSGINDALPSNGAAATVTNIDVTAINGTCGGSATISGSYNDISGDLSLNANFNGYCEGGTTLNGAISLSGNAIATSSSLNITTFTITLSNLSASHGGDSFSSSGTMTITPQTGYTYLDNNIVLTVDMLFKDNVSNKVYKLENYAMSVSSTLSYDDIDISGRYYDPDYGYIDISTPTTLRVYLPDEWPSTGVIHATGDNSSVTITALDNTTYQLDIDDGISNFQETGMWAEL